MLIDYFSRGEAPHINAVRSLQKWHLACLAAELVFLAIFLLAAKANPAAAPSLALLLSDAIFPTALIGALGFGIVLPFALETSLPVSDFVCLIGALCLRWTVIVCGVH